MNQKYVFATLLLPCTVKVASTNLLLNQILDNWHLYLLPQMVRNASLPNVLLKVYVKQAPYLTYLMAPFMVLLHTPSFFTKAL